MITVFGQSVFLFFGGVSAFGAPMEGQAFLAGMNLDRLPDSAATTMQTYVLLVGILLSFVGNVLLGVAVWRSRSLPRVAGALWVVAALLMYPFGIILGALTTGATPITVPIGAVLIAVSGGWLTWRARSRQSTENVPGQPLLAP